MPELSARAKKTWRRLTEWYGIRFVEQYGKDPPEDWWRLIDKTDNDTIRRGLAIVRRRYLEFPPTLPQFEQAMHPAISQPNTPSPADLLCKFIMTKYGARLTDKQIREPWTYFGTRGGEIAGVTIPADGERAGYRITVIDMNTPEGAIA